MTVPIKCNKKIILYVSNRLFGWLHRSLMKIAEENEVAQEGPIADFLEKTDQDQRGPGNVMADIADYFKTRKDVVFFALLVERAVLREKEYFEKIEGAFEEMRRFHQELLNYAQELE